MNNITNASKTCLIIIRMLKDEKKSSIYSVDIAKRLGITRQSVCRTISKLFSDKLIILNKDKTIELTEDGLNISNELYHKFLFVSKLFNNSLNEKEKLMETINITNIISDESLQSVYRLYNKN